MQKAMCKVPLSNARLILSAIINLEMGMGVRGGMGMVKQTIGELDMKKEHLVSQVRKDGKVQSRATKKGEEGEQKQKRRVTDDLSKPQ